MIKHYKHFIFTNNLETMLKFYKDCLGFNVTDELKHPQDYGYNLEINPGGLQIWLAKHSEVTGRSEDPFRVMLNLYTDDVEGYFKKATDWPGVKVVAEPFSMTEMNPDENPERMAATILDPDGNALQFMNPSS